MRYCVWLALLPVVGCAKSQTTNERTGSSPAAVIAPTTPTTVSGTLVINDQATSTQVPAPSQQVALEGSPTAIQSDGSGNFSMTIQPGQIAVTTSLTDGTLSWYAYGTVNGKTYGIEQHGITVTEGQSNDLGTVLMHWSADVKGLVVANGAPVAGATVQVPGTIFTTTTDQTGAFDLSLAAATWTVQISATGDQTYTSNALTITPQQVEDLGTITLESN